ncbi:Tetratricopeptide repeat-containing protein [Prevotella sp. KH2C16]|nr:Tetratricopeptide repeat-containing protein [Prevotella sp. KH2C16]
MTDIRNMALHPSQGRMYSLSLFLLLLLPSFIKAQQVLVSAPSRVSVGENFRISYTVNTRDVEDFRSGLKSTEEVEVIAGPYTSQQSSYQMINGHTSSSSSITYTYTLYANQNGTFTIPPAHVRIGGKSISSQARKVVISGHAQTSGNSAPRMHEEDRPQMRSAGSRISGNDLFIKVSANKRHVHEQEPILLTYKVYTLLDLTQLEGKMPDLTGFHTQEVKLPQQKSFHIENVNGRNYRCVTWSQYVMYPQMTGKLEIPSITFHGIVVQENRAVDPFEAFFNGGSGYIEVKRDIVAPSITVQVDPLPERPAGFSGGVGRFNISAQIDKTSVQAGDPVNLRIVIGGTGNLKLIKQPVVQFPKDFDKYDAKVTDKTKLTANGVEGNMIYDILAVPRNQGKYEIPPVELSYYDTSANAYKTLKTKPFTIEVAPGNGKAANMADYADQQDKDIHGIMTGNSSLHAVDSFFFGSTAYWISLLIPLIAFIALLIIFRKRAIENSDIVAVRGKKASKVATKRLKKANQLMLRGQQSEFYDEVLRALWGYVGDKLNMPVEKLSRDNIAENLSSHQVDELTVGKFIDALDECEFMRYAPGDASGNMNKTFELAMTAIMEIENVMKKKKTSTKLNMVILLFGGMMLFPGTLFGSITKQSADQLYKTGNYQQAIKEYSELLKKGVSPELYYNLGNAYFRTDNITQAVLAYERAHMLSPGNEDINFNLQFARSKTIDKITPESEMFFVTWYRSAVNFTSVDHWAYVGLACIILALVLFLSYLFASRMLLRKVGFFGSVIFFLIFILSNIFAYQQKAALGNRSGAIVIAPAVNVKKTPSKGGTDDFVIHEGTRVDITDKSMQEWRGIHLADGREGWILTNQIEEI